MVFVESAANLVIASGAAFAQTISGDDGIYGTRHADTIYGYGGWDYLYGRDGRDRLAGMDGWKDLYGQAGNDGLWGGTGNDCGPGYAGLWVASDTKTQRADGGIMAEQQPDVPLLRVLEEIGGL